MGQAQFTSDQGGNCGAVNEERGVHAFDFGVANDVFCPIFTSSPTKTRLLPSSPGTSTTTSQPLYHLCPRWQGLSQTPTLGFRSPYSLPQSQRPS